MVTDTVQTCSVEVCFSTDFPTYSGFFFYRCGRKRSRWGLQEAGLAELATNGEPEKETQQNCPFLAEG